MKRLALILLTFVFLTTCVTGCGVLGASDAAASDSTSAPAQEGLQELSRFDGAGLYEIGNLDDGTPYLSYIDSATATQKTVCTREGCTHADITCPAVAAAWNGNLLGCYNGSLLYRDYSGDTPYEIVDETTTTLAASDTNGENYRVLATLPSSLAQPKEFLYNGALLLFTDNVDGWLFHSVDLESGAVTQIAPEPISGLDNYLGVYEDSLYFMNIREGAQSYDYEIVSVQAATGEKTVLYTAQQAIDPQVFTTTNYSFAYHEGKIYQLATATLKGTDILTEIDCATGEARVVDDSISCEGAHGQMLVGFVQDTLILETIANVNDLPVPQPKRFAYDLTDHTMTPISLTIAHPDGNFISPVMVMETMGDNLLVEYKYTQTTPLALVSALLSTTDYLASAPNYRDIVVVGP